MIDNEFMALASSVASAAEARAAACEDGTAALDALAGRADAAWGIVEAFGGLAPRARFAPEAVPALKEAVGEVGKGLESALSMLDFGPWDLSELREAVAIAGAMSGEDADLSITNVYCLICTGWQVFSMSAGAWRLVALAAESVEPIEGR